MYDNPPMNGIIGDGYVRTCGGLESTTVDVKITENGGIVTELGNWITVVNSL